MVQIPKIGAPKSTDQQSVEQVWNDICADAEAHLAAPDAFGIHHFLRTSILGHASLDAALAHNLGSKMMSVQGETTGLRWRELIGHALENDPSIVHAVATDLCRFLKVDPACEGLLWVFSFYKGFHAVTCARVGSYFYRSEGKRGKLIARMLQGVMSDVYGVDIHPGCRLGRGVVMDHATGVTIGETAVIGDGVYLMHDVTLGATGSDDEHDRHPKIGNGVFLGAKSTVLGNVSIGDGSTVAAAALVNKPVPPYHTAVGVPARIIPPKDTASFLLAAHSGSDASKAKPNSEGGGSDSSWRWRAGQ